MSQANSKTAPQWPRVPFAQALSDNTAAQPKVLRRDYLGRGALAVVDQGATMIAGYTDDWSMAYRGTLPVILFGDHTRLVKYVDFPFALGADGVKALEPTPAYVAKFLYYYLVATDIPQRGYSRHFQFLREIQCPLAALSEQRRIVQLLDRADRLRRLRAEADAKADRILPALFRNTFGSLAGSDRGTATERLDSLVDIGGPLVDPNGLAYLDLPHVGGEHIEKETGRLLSLQSVRDSRLRSAKFFFTENHVLYCKIRPYLNKVAYPRIKGVCSADIYPLLPKDRRIGPWYLTALLRTDEFLTYARGQSDRLRMPKLNRDQLGSYPISVPSADVLASFEGRAATITSLAEKRLRSRVCLDRLFELLLHRAFSGELTSSWRETHMTGLLQEMEHQTKALAATAWPE